MAKKITSKKAASAASKVLLNKNSGKNSKTAAGSALSQREKSVANYTCPNCGGSKSTLRGRCPQCAYSGLK